MSRLPFTIPGVLRPLVLCSLAIPFGIGSTLNAAEKEIWTPISAGVLSQVKPGYPGKTAGVTVDPASGDVYMVVPDQGIWKSTDHGEKFERVDGGKIGGRCETGFALNFDPAGKRLMCFMIYGGVGYWTSDKGLLVSKDQGKSWQVLGTPISAVIGPLWGKSAEHLVVVAKDGLHESKDGGKTWSKAAPLPTGFTVGGVGPNYAWDPIGNIFYASSMGKDTFRYER